jgi:outer membrane protein TolC
MAFGDVKNDFINHVEIKIPAQLVSGLENKNQSLTMKDAVKLGVANNLGLQVFEAEIEVKCKILEQAKAERWPVISLGSLTFIRSGNSQTLMTPETMMNTVDETVFEDVNLSGKIPIYTGGRIKNRINAAKAGIEGSQASLQQAIVNTAFQIKQNYLTIQLSYAEHLTHQQHLETQQALLKNSEARYKSGRGLKADALRIRTEAANAQKALNEQHVKLNNALYDLKAAMGLDLASDIKVTEPLTATDWTGSHKIDGLIQEALTRHPKIIELQKAVDETASQIKVAKSRYYPQVDGQITGNLRFPDRPEEMGNGVISLLTVTMPLLDKNRSTELAKSQAEHKKAQQALRAFQLETSASVAKAWNELTFAKENIALAETAVVQSLEDLRLMQRRYEVGRAVMVEAQDAAWKLLQSRLDKAQSIYNHEMAKANLLKALGKIEL